VKLLSKTKTNYVYQINGLSNGYSLNEELQYTGDGVWEIIWESYDKIIKSFDNKNKILNILNILYYSVFKEKQNSISAEISRATGFGKNHIKREVDKNKDNEYVFKETVYSITNTDITIIDAINLQVSILEQFIKDLKPIKIKLNIPDRGPHNNFKKIIKKIIKKFNIKLSELGYYTNFDKNILIITKL